MRDANQAMYPETAQLQEQLAGQASEGMNAQMPNWMQEQYQSNMNANLGNNVGSGIGADYMSRGMMQQQQDYQNYYRNLGLSVAGRQPLAMPNTPQTANYSQQFTPNANMGFMSQNYATNAAANSSQTTKGGVNLGILGRWGG